jgi:peptidoglycan/LPS O-acetylase OafA/YrhL
MLLFWAVIVILANTLQPPLHTPGPAYIALHPFTLEFISGAVAALLLYRRSTQLRSGWTVLIPAVIILPLGIALVDHYNIVNSMGLLRAATLGTLYGLLVYTAALLETATGWQPPGVMVFFGNISYTLYLSHILVLSAIGRLWRSVSPAPASLVDNAVVLPIMVLAVTGGGWLAYRLVERPALGLSHRLRDRWFGRPIASRSGWTPQSADRKVS